MEMKHRKYLIVFDIDGTLTDSVQQHQSAFVAALRHMGVQEINTDFKAYKHHTDSHIAKAIYEADRKTTFGPEELSEFEALLYEGIATTSLSAIKGAAQMLKSLQQQPDFGLCFATGSLYRPAVYKLQQAGIAFEPSLLVASNAIEDRERIVLAAIEQAKRHYQQEHFERIISVGDGLWDLLTAQKLGLEFIGIGPVHMEALTRHGMTTHLQDWSDAEQNPFSIYNNSTPAGIKTGTP